MGKRREKKPKSQTLPSSPCHSLSSSSSSDFEFMISRSPHKAAAMFCPADDLFYKGQLLPLQLSPRLSMVRTLILASSSSSDSATTSSRDSSGSSADSHSSFTATTDGCDSSRPSSVAEDDREYAAKPHAPPLSNQDHYYNGSDGRNSQIKKNKYFSLSRFSSVFRKDAVQKPRPDPDHGSGSSVKRVSASAKDVFRKYLKKVKPFYEKLSHQQKQQKETFAAIAMPTARSAPLSANLERSVNDKELHAVQSSRKDSISHSFSGNLRYPRRRSCVSSCPSSIRSSPSHSGVLSRNGGAGGFVGRMGISNNNSNNNNNNSYYGASSSSSSSSSSMEELQSAIQGAIAYCKSSMVRSETMVSNEI